MPTLIRRLAMSARHINPFGTQHCAPPCRLLHCIRSQRPCVAVTRRMRPLQPLSSLNHSILPQHLGGNLRCRVVPSAASRQALRYLQDTEIDLTYDADANSGYWQQRPVSVVSRAIHIAAVFGGWFVAGKLRIGSQPDAILAADQKQAMKMRNILTALGPAFVKIGQAVSSRPDIVSPLYLAELEKLQDQIPPFPNEDAFALIQMETGKPPSALFAELTPETVAAASLGQVYKGRLRVGGQTVAVKVQRPGVREQISLDVHILRQALWLLRRLRKLNRTWRRRKHLGRFLTRLLTRLSGNIGIAAIGQATTWTQGGLLCI